MEDSLHTLAQKHATTRFIKLHHEIAEMENVGIPAIIAYQNGDVMATLTDCSAVGLETNLRRLVLVYLICSSLANMIQECYPRRYCILVSINPPFRLYTYPVSLLIVTTKFPNKHQRVSSISSSPAQSSECILCVALLVSSRRYPL